MIKGKTIFITGGAGFIGSHLCERLIENNRIIIFDNEHRNAIKMTRILDHPNMNFIKGDILVDDLKEAMKGADIVIHCAAIAGIDTVVKKPIVTMKVNFFGTYNVLEAAVHNHVEKFIDFSTSEVYGPNAYKVEEEGMTMQGAVGPKRWTYAVSKLAAEHLAHCYSEEYSMKVISIRPFNIYGPRQVGEGAIHQFIVNALEGKDLTIHSDGTQIRAWCYIDDFIEGVLKCMESNDAENKSFNIGNPQGTITILQLAKEIIRLTGSNSKIVFQKVTSPDVDLRIPSIKNMQKLGFEPNVDLSDGIQKTIAWYKEHITTLS